MDDPPEDPGTRPGPLVPALLAVLAVTFVAALLLSAWHTRVGGPLPQWLFRVYGFLLAVTAVVFLGTIFVPGKGVPLPREPASAQDLG